MQPFPGSGCPKPIDSKEAHPHEHTRQDRSSSPRQWWRSRWPASAAEHRPATSASPRRRRPADGRAHADRGPVCDARPDAHRRTQSDSGLLPGGEPSALKPGRYAIASLHNGVPPQLGTVIPGCPSRCQPAGRETRGWSGRPSWMAAQPRRSCSIGSSTMGSRTRVPTTPRSCRKPDPGRPGSSASSPVSQGSTREDLRNSPAGITDVTVGGHDGKYLDYSVTADPAACGNGHDGFWIWGACPPPVTIGCEDADGGDARWGASKGNRERAYAIDVDGTIYTFFTAQPSRPDWPRIARSSSGSSTRSSSSRPPTDPPARRAGHPCIQTARFGLPEPIAMRRT